MPLAYIPGRTYNSLIEVLAGRLNSTIYSFSTGKRACDTADDLTERLEAIFKASLSRKYVPSKYTLNQGRIISEKITSILIGIEYACNFCSYFIEVLNIIIIRKCTSVDSHSTSLQVIFMLATRFPNFHHYFTDKDVITRLLFDESKYNELIARKFGHKDQAMLKKLANITRLSLKEDAPSNGYARQLYLSLGGLDALDPDSTAPVKMLQSALYALSNFFTSLIVHWNLQQDLRSNAHRAFSLERMDASFNQGQARAYAANQPWHRACVRAVEKVSHRYQGHQPRCHFDVPWILCAQDILDAARRRIARKHKAWGNTETVRAIEVISLFTRTLTVIIRISLAQCYELAWHLSRFLWEQYKRILSIQLGLIGWETKGMEKAEECVHIIRNTYAQAIEAICNMTH